MKVEMRFMNDDPNSIIITEDIKIVLDGSPEIVDKMKILIEEYFINVEWERI